MKDSETFADPPMTLAANGRFRPIPAIRLAATRPIADISDFIEIGSMPRRFVVPALLALALGSCSYGYQVLAIAQNGRLAFIVSPKSDHHPSCLRLIEVLADDGTKAKPEVGDDASRVGYGTYWFESVDYDDACANHFPIAYGASLEGRHQQVGIVKAKPLRREVVYSVSTTTGATGYGGGRFIIHAGGHIENLAQR